MNKADLINALAAKNEISKKDAEKAVNAVLGLIEEALKNGECLVCGAQQAKNLGKQSVKAIAMDLNDEEVAKQVLLDVVLLTADNVNHYTDFIEENVCTVE